MNFSQLIEHWAQRGPARPALHFEGEVIGYGDLWRHIVIAADTLAHEQGVRSGDRVAWLGFNHPRQLVLLFALARLRAIAVPLNLRLAAPELQHIVAHAGAKLLFSDDSLWPLAEAVAAASNVQPLRWPRPAWADSASPQAQRAPARSPPMPDAPGTDDEAPLLLVYSSGTTGHPKGALHTQGNLWWNSFAAIQGQGLTADDHALAVLPLFHVGGLNIQTLPLLAAGGLVTLHARFDAGAWLADVAAPVLAAPEAAHAPRTADAVDARGTNGWLAPPPTVSLMVPATLRAVIDHPAWAATPLHGLRCISAGSSIVPLPLIEAFHARGVPVAQVYGATETGPVSIVLRPDEAFAAAGSAGWPALGVQARLVDPQTDPAQWRGAMSGPPEVTGVAAGAVGEVWLRGRNVVSGYWQPGPAQPALEEAAFVDDWFRSGDLARRDADGRYWIVGRVVEMIISGGENIYPAEIEQLLAESPHIEECAVLGVPDSRWGEVVAAVIVLIPGAVLDEGGVLALLEGKLARFKHPKRLRFVEQLPKTALGKVQKALLREGFASG